MSYRPPLAARTALANLHVTLLRSASLDESNNVDDIASDFMVELGWTSDTISEDALYTIESLMQVAVLIARRDQCTCGTLHDEHDPNNCALEG